MAVRWVQQLRETEIEVQPRSDSLVGPPQSLTSQGRPPMSYLDLTAKFETKISEARYRLRINAIPTMAWCSSPDGSVEFFNQRWHDYTGLSFEEARGWGWKTVIHPD